MTELQIVLFILLILLYELITANENGGGVMFTKIRTSVANWLMKEQISILNEKIKTLDKRLDNEMLARKNETTRMMKELGKDWVADEMDKADIKHLEESVSEPILPEK